MMKRFEYWSSSFNQSPTNFKVIHCIVKSISIVYGTCSLSTAIPFSCCQFLFHVRRLPMKGYSQMRNS